MSRSCPGHVQMSCPGHVQVVSKSCQGHVQMSCPGHVQVMSRSCPGHVQVVSRCRVRCRVQSCPSRVQVVFARCWDPTTSCVLCPPACRWTTYFQFPVVSHSCVAPRSLACSYGLVLLGCVLSTWCSKNEGWTNYIRSDHPRRACSSAERSPPTTAAILVELRLSACIARNGALGDHRRTPSAESHARFRSARHTFHRTIRSALRAFWTNWQEHVSALSVLNPRVAAATVRRTFQLQNEDRHAQPCGGQIVLVALRGVILPHIGGSISHQFMFTPALSTKISSSARPTVSPICVPLRKWVSLILLSLLPSCDAFWGVCVDSAVDLDGVPYSLFKVPFPWWQFALFNSFHLILFLESCSRDVQTQHRGARLETWRCFCSDQLPPHLPCLLLFQTLRASDTSPYWTSHLFPTRSVSRWFPIGRRCFGQFSRRRPFLPQFHPHVRRFRGNPENV